LSSTNIAAPGIGDPIGTTAGPGTSGVLIEAHTVFSVGPYASIITRPGAAQRSTTSGGQASPATTNAVDSNPSAESIATADGVWVSTLTC
jgi:hypothetical protein